MLNIIKRKDGYLLSRIDNIRSTLVGSQIFSTLEEKSIEESIGTVQVTGVDDDDWQQVELSSE